MNVSIFSLSLIAFTTLATANNSVVVELSPFAVNARQDEQTTFSLPGKTIQLQRPADLSEMLAQSLPGVQLVRKGAASNDFRLRGLGGDDVNVIQDGQRVYCACPNRMDPPASHTETSAIERIRIVSGAFDLRYAGALGGTVAVETRDPQPGRAGEIDLGVGSFGFLHGGFVLEGGSEELAGLLSASHSQSDPYRDGDGTLLTDLTKTSASPLDDYEDSARERSAYAETRVAAKVAWTPRTDQRHTAIVSYRDANDILYPALRMDADFSESIAFALLSEWEAPLPFIDNLSSRVYYNTTDHDMSDRYRLSSTMGMNAMSRPAYVLERGYYMLTQAEAATIGLHLEGDKDYESGSLLFGLEAFDRAWDINNRLEGDKDYESGSLLFGLEAFDRAWDINNRLGAGNATAGAAAEIFNDMIPDTHEQVYGAFAEYILTLGDQWDLTTGLRVDRYETTADAASPILDAVWGAAQRTNAQTVVSGKALLRWMPTEQTSFYAGTGYTARPLNGQELYISLQRPGVMPNWVGNPNLSAPRLHEFTIGLEHVHEQIRFNARAYTQQLTDYVYPERRNPDQTGFAKAIQTFTGIDASLGGIELDATWQIHARWTAKAAFNWQEAQKESQPLNNQDPDLAEIPAATLKAQINYQSDTWYALIEAHYFASQDHVDESLGETPNDATTVFNLRAGWDLPVGGTLTVSVENLFDTTYRLHNAYVRNPFGSDALINEPGRSLYLRYRYPF